MGDLPVQEARARSGRRRWEPPAMFKVLLGAHTNLAQSATSEASHPPLPVASVSKLGFSIELAFPMATRTET